MFYFYVVCTVIILSFLVERYNSKIALLLLMLILSLLCGLRGPEVGVDTQNYIQFLTDIESIGPGYGSDLGFSLISYGLMSYFHFAHIPLLLFGIITNVLIILRLWEYRDKAYFPMMILIYLAFFYHYTFILVRQYLAIAIIFWGSRYIDKGKIRNYLVLNAIAFLIHTTAIICVLLVFISSYRKKNKNKRIISFVLLGLLTLFLLGAFDSRIEKFKSYTDLQNFGLQIMTLLEVVVFTIVTSLSSRIYYKRFAISKSGIYFSVKKSLTITYGLGLLMFSMGMFITYTGRLGMYFLFFEMPFWGQLSRARANKFIYVYPILVVVLVKLFYILVSNEDMANYSTFIDI